MSMSLLSSIRSGTRSSLDQGYASTSSPTRQAEAEVPLPRHLLVTLAAIAAEVTSLRQRFVDDPQLHEPLDRILGRLDGLVDSIYPGDADLRAHLVAGSGGHGSAITADPAAAVGVLAWSGEHRASPA
jgi:hypothetical protein